MIDITQRMVDNATIPKGREQSIVRDTELKGFGLRLTTGGKSYVVEARINGKSKRLTIGRADVLSVDEARKEAIRLLAQMTTGADPQLEKKRQATSLLTVGQVLDHYLTVQRLRPATVSKTRGVLKNHLKDWLGKPITSITFEMIQTRHNQLGAVGHDTANTAIKKLGMLFNFAINNLGLEADNPVDVMTRNRAWFKLKKNPIVIPDHMLPAWSRACMATKRPAVRDYLLLLLLTGLRRNEALTLRWEDIDFESRTLTIPAEVSKTYVEHKLPLTDFVLALLTERKTGDSKWVFPRGNGDRHMANPQVAMENIAKYSGCKFSPHVLRRSFCSLASRMGVPHHIVRKMLNHSQNVDVSSTYIVIGLECLREPLQQISDKFLDLMEYNHGAAIPVKRCLKPPTLDEVLRAYCLAKKLRLTTQTNYEKAIRVNFGDWQNLPVNLITEQMVNDRKEALLKNKCSSTINQSFCVLRALLYFAASNYETPAGKSLIEKNPVRDLVKLAPSSYRQSHLDDSLLPAWYSALMTIEWKTTRDYLLFVLLTGLRMNEAMTLLWSDVDFDAGIIKIRAEACKNGHGYSLPLPKFLIQFLIDRKLACGQSAYVFPGRANKGHLRSCQRVVEEVSRKIGQEFIISDLRRTFIFTAARAGISESLIKQLVNSRDNRGLIFSTGDIDQLRAAMETITTRMLNLMAIYQEEAG